MKVMWVLNLLPAVVGERLGIECSVKEGWISGLLGRIIEAEEGGGASGRLALALCYPVKALGREGGQKVFLGKESRGGDGQEEEAAGLTVSCYQFAENTDRPERYDEPALVKRFGQIFEEFKPDILHLFGTEYGHSLAAAKAFGRPRRVLLGLQGIISECAKEYMADLPPRVYERASFRDWLKEDGMARQQEKFALRGEREKQTLIFCGNITGRTGFDKEFSRKINPAARYFFMNETLRKEFYEGAWDIGACVRNRIFFSQADYPLKGFHYLLKALARVREAFPETAVRVAGNSLVKDSTLGDRIKISAYGLYLRQLIRETGMEGRVDFTGRLTAKEMKREYLSCHTFVCASSLENSPNSVGEAMLLGTPVIASRTGGIPGLLTHDKEGLLFTKGDVESLASSIIRLWEDDGLCGRYSGAAKIRAGLTHDGEGNYRRLMEIYDEILTPCRE